jgi:hypothetical protein
MMPRFGLLAADASRPGNVPRRGWIDREATRLQLDAATLAEIGA